MDCLQTDWNIQFIHLFCLAKLHDNQNVSNILVRHSLAFAYGEFLSKDILRTASFTALKAWLFFMPHVPPCMSRDPIPSMGGELLYPLTCLTSHPWNHFNFLLFGFLSPQNRHISIYEIRLFDRESCHNEGYQNHCCVVMSSLNSIAPWMQSFCSPCITESKQWLQIYCLSAIV